MKQLILAEKPSVARDLSQILGAKEKHQGYYEGSNVVVTWALGHLLGLKMPEDLKPEWQKWQMETLPMLPNKIGIKPLPKTGRQLKVISNLAKRKDIKEAVIATDAGREGELVARFILQYIHFNKPVKRLWISSQTVKAVKEGFKKLKPAQAYDNLYKSALARATADWLVGLNVTRALTVKYQDNLAAGRVQTPTLALVNQREQEIAKFIPQKYYSVSLKMGSKTAKLVQKNPYQFKEKNQAQALVDKISKSAGIVDKISRKQTKKPSPLPYDLTELQRQANEKYGYSAKKTLSLVQSLYEIHKVVSYPRTDSKYLSDDLLPSMKERLQAISSLVEEAKIYAKAGGKIVQKQAINNAKVTDHHALIPTEQRPQYSKMSADEHRIYAMIAKRFAGLFAQPFTEEKVKYDLDFAGQHFTLNQAKVLEAGWNSQAKNDTELLELKEGQKVKGTFVIAEKLTTPPTPLTEGSLLALMEKYGLGTPATRAETIEKLVSSELMERQGKNLHVTKKGQQLLHLVNPALVTPELTAKWEKELEGIAQGKVDEQKFIFEIKNDTKKLVKELKASKESYKDYALTQKKCTECGSLLREKKVRDGKLLVCSSDTCSYRRRAEAKVTNHRCPQCHKKMLLISGPNGDYFRCKFDGTTEKPGAKKGKKKMTKHEERKLMQKINRDDEPQESALALALKAAMDK